MIDALGGALPGLLIVLAQEGRQLQGLEVVVRRIGHDAASVNSPMYELAEVVATSARGK